MEFVHAIILGLVQGIAEFLPISSSGHLVIVDALLRDLCGTAVPSEGATMGIALHFGTLMSILVVYRKDFRLVLADRYLVLMIVAATVPMGVIGILFKSQIEQAFQEPILAGAALLVTAVFLVVGRWLQRHDESDSHIGLRSALTIGLFQAVAVVPGISRSGSTIAAGMACGHARASAARFSFLIAIPAIGGASLMQLKDILTGEASASGNPLAIALGTVIAFAVGVVALRWLLRLVVADRLHLFAVYCSVAGILTIGWQLLR